MTINLRDILAGLVFLGFALAFGIASFNYGLGAALNMGPAYFPRIVAGLLGILGIAIILSALKSDRVTVGEVSIRAVILLLAAPLLFAVTVRGLGLIPAMVLATATSAASSRDASVFDIVAITLTLTVLGYLLFVRALGVSTPLLGPWLGY